VAAIDYRFRFAAFGFDRFGGDFFVRGGVRFFTRGFGLAFGFGVRRLIGAVFRVRRRGTLARIAS
jgi:hypothetical protein